MKRKLLVISFSLFVLFSSAQIVNGNFETWNSISWQDLDGANTSNGDAISYGVSPNSSRTTDMQSGNYAIHLETVAVGWGDTLFGYFLFGNFDNDPSGGVPYTQNPSTINGYYKYDIQPGDTALLLVAFWDNDSVVSIDTFAITGLQNTYIPFTYSLNIPGGTTTDSVTIAGTSSNPFANSIKAGSWINFDNITFAGSGITQQVFNTDFESWTNVTVEDPAGWYTSNTFIKQQGLVQAEKSTDAYAGTYAIKINTVWMDTFWSITNIFCGVDEGGGVPYTNVADTLIGYYKYIPQGTDSAGIGVSFSKNGVTFDGTGMFLPPASSYTYFEIPFNLSQAPDTVRIDIMSSNWPVDISNNGSALYIDELQFKSAPLGIEKLARAGKIQVYPNPAFEYLKLDYILEKSEDVTFTVYDISGKEIFKKSYTNQPYGKNQIHLNTSDLSTGSYFYNLSGKDEVISKGNFIVK